MKLSTYNLGLLLVTASAIAWSTAGLFTRLLDLSVTTVLLWRGTFGAIGVLAFIMVSQRENILKGFKSLGAPGWLLVAVSALGMQFFIFSLETTTVAHVSVIYAVVPFIAAGLGWLLLGEVPMTNATIASIAALAGVFIMMGWGSEGTMLGDVLALAMTVCMALIIIIARKWPGIPTLHAACASAVVSALAVLPLSEPLSPSGIDWIVLVAFGLVNSAIGMALFALGSKLLPPIETALISSLDAPLAPLWVWLIFSEAASLPTLAGGIIVFVAVLAHIVTTTQSEVARESV